MSKTQRIHIPSTVLIGLKSSSKASYLCFPVQSKFMKSGISGCFLNSQISTKHQKAWKETGKNMVQSEEQHKSLEIG